MTPDRRDYSPPPKRRWTYTVTIHGDSEHSIADRLYDLATDMLHCVRPAESVGGGRADSWCAALVENDPTMTHDRYVAELAAWREMNNPSPEGER